MKTLHPHPFRCATDNEIMGWLAVDWKVIVDRHRDWRGYYCVDADTGACDRLREDGLCVRDDDEYRSILRRRER